MIQLFIQRNPVRMKVGLGFNTSFRLPILGETLLNDVYQLTIDGLSNFDFVTPYFNHSPVQLVTVVVNIDESSVSCCTLK